MSIFARQIDLLLMKHLSKFSYIGIVLELFVLGVSYAYAKNDVGLFFQLSARFSGRVSLLLFCMLFVYATLHPSLERKSEPLSVKFILARNFAISHLIHWVFLAIAMNLNDRPLVPVKLIGGALAYLMIVMLPFILKIKRINNTFLKWALHVYLFYVWLIFFITYLSRVAGSSNPPFASVKAVYYGVTFVLVTGMIWRCYIIVSRSLKRNKI